MDNKACTVKPRYRCTVCGQQRRESRHMRRIWADITADKPLGLACSQWCAVRLLKQAMEVQ